MRAAAPFFILLLLAGFFSLSGGLAADPPSKNSRDSVSKSSPGLRKGLPEAEYLPVTDLDSGERERLEEGRAVVRLFSRYRQMRLREDAPRAHLIYEPLKKVRPNLMAEAMYFIPVPPGREAYLLREARAILQSFDTFEQIPYYSRRNETTTPLFADVSVKSAPVQVWGAGAASTEADEPVRADPARNRPDSAAGIGAEIEEEAVASMRMIPFERYTSLFRYRLDEESFLYDTYNTSPIHYRFIRVLRPRQMHTFLLLTAGDGCIFMYAAGGADAFTLFGLFKGRIHDAFAGRVDAVVKWFHAEFTERVEAIKKDIP